MRNSELTKIEPTPSGRIATVNAMFAAACIAGGVAVWLWPHSPGWWTFYPLSVACGAAALACVVQGLTLIRNIRRFERYQREYLEEGRPLKAATLPEEEFLTKQGVIRHVK